MAKDKNGVRICATEEQEQIVVIHWAEMFAAGRPELGLLFHIPNGGKRTKSEAARFKAAGVCPGIPDLFLPVARGGYHGLWIEMKAKEGRVSPAQRDMMERLTAQGYRCVVCFSADEAIAKITEYLEG